MKEALSELQRNIYQQEVEATEGIYDIGDSARLYYAPVGDLYDLYFYGNGYDDYPHIPATELEADSNRPFCSLLDFIARPEHAGRIASLTFDGPDEGSNGTKNWDFTRLIHADAFFPNLKQLSVQQCDWGDHNFNIIGRDYEEEGMIARLLSKMPHLEALTVPSAPDRSFFDIPGHPLKYLKVQAGYDHQGFIRNLAASTNFPQLAVLDFTDFMDTNNASTADFVPFEDFKALFTSPAFSTVRHFTLRGSILTRGQLLELQTLRRDVQFLHVAATCGQYVSHMRETE